MGKHRSWDLTPLVLPGNNLFLTMLIDTLLHQLCSRPQDCQTWALVTPTKDGSIDMYRLHVCTPMNTTPTYLWGQINKNIHALREIGSKIYRHNSFLFTLYKYIGDCKSITHNKVHTFASTWPRLLTQHPQPRFLDKASRSCLISITRRSWCSPGSVPQSLDSKGGSQGCNMFSFSGQLFGGIRVGSTISFLWANPNPNYKKTKGNIMWCHPGFLRL